MLAMTGLDAGAPIGILCALPQEQELLVVALGDPAPLPGITPEPGYQLPADLELRVRSHLARTDIAATFGTIVCGDAFLVSPRVRDQLEADWSALAIEMESAAICGVAERFDVPWLIVRALSDRAGETSMDDFSTFVASAAASSARLARVLLAVFDE